MEQVKYKQIEANSNTEELDENLEDREHIDFLLKIESLNMSMLKYQFDYIDRIRNKIISPLEGDAEIKNIKRLGDLLANSTTFCRYVAEGYKNRRFTTDDSSSPEEIDSFHKAKNSFVSYVISKINFLESDNKEEWSNGWSDKLLELVTKEISDLGSIVENLNKEDKNKKTGLICSNISNAGDLAFKNGWVNSPYDEVINIHFDELYKQKTEDKSIKNISSGESFSKLAEKIVSECPQIKAVVGKSWLVDSSIGRRVGFEIDKTYKKTSNSIDFWGQFIDEQGKIKEDKIKKFLETGIPDHYTTKGHIDVESFLKKYLAEDKRGIIKLKDISPQSLVFRGFLKEVEEKIDKNWNNISIEGIVTILNSNQDVADYLKTPDGKEYLHVITKAKKVGFDKIEEEIKKQVNENWKKYKEVKANIFIEREVLID